jgi:anti-sigma factor RsiW
MASPHVLDRIDGYLDREFDAATSLGIERHLEACAKCRAEADRRAALLLRVVAQGSRYPAPTVLRRRISKAVAAETRPAWLAGRPVRLLTVAVSFVLVAGLSSGITAYLLHAPVAPGLEEQVVASHVRSLLVENRATDVASSDEHSVKPWFAHRLNFAPPVQDWTAQGYPLVGGRLDYLADRTVAALVYRHRQHLINVFIWPEARVDDVHLASRVGYSVVHWSDGAMTFWAISDLNPAELREFCDLMKGGPRRS